MQVVKLAFLVDLFLVKLLLQHVKIALSVDLDPLQIILVLVCFVKVVFINLKEVKRNVFHVYLVDSVLKHKQRHVLNVKKIGTRIK